MAKPQHNNNIVLMKCQLKIFTFKKWKSPARFLSPATNAHGEGRLNPRVINTVWSEVCSLASIEGLTVEQIFAHDLGFVEKMIAGARELEREGVKAITGDCGFMAIYQKEVRESVNIPVFLSSLLQIPFIKTTLPENAKIGIITANSRSLTADVFKKIGVADDPVVIFGLENSSHFKEAVFDEIGLLDSDRIREEVVGIAKELTTGHPAIRTILLECSMLPPYGKAVQQSVNLPVYDYLTMIDYVYSAVVKRRFNDAM